MRSTSCTTPFVDTCSIDQVVAPERSANSRYHSTMLAAATRFFSVPPHNFIVLNC